MQPTKGKGAYTLRRVALFLHGLRSVPSEKTVLRVSLLTAESASLERRLLHLPAVRALIPPQVLARHTQLLFDAESPPRGYQGRPRAPACNPARVQGYNM